ncbi:hypothetical protein AGABI2DRAFT_138133, partial [Agaricus bisporus var. bisporus H97]|uniref:hypothetical protein n=1 Tax=Agaricus bisporus var. bisporus (strain H97 / ATCC MYA-4626 / FGSC 10389) TaxID=936046 RepID=UPI00029F68E8
MKIFEMRSPAKAILRVAPEKPRSKSNGKLREAIISNSSREWSVMSLIKAARWSSGSRFQSSECHDIWRLFID